MLKSVSSITNAIGALNFKGTWNASTNTPTIVSGVGVKGDYFVVSVAGSTTIDNISNWGVGDWIVYNGNIWQRVEGGADLNGVNLTVTNTTTLSGLTASTALALNASKEVVSVVNTGTGDNVLATSPTLVTPVLGTPTSGTLSGCTVDGTDAVGFRTIPQNSQSTAYTLVLADSGKHILHPTADTTARTFTIPANSSVAYPVGTALTFINQNGAGVVTIAITTDTMRLSPAGTTGSRTLAANGSATCIKLTSTEWIISGSGLT